ncbi:FecR family protein [Eilatimonas milleporae]|uniref:FecR family protein n=1 Tax=Eilatimonas milleporae TaxID=911205 RepID=A0A3M0CUT8_9PROT|nr:FecR domain-containing protein [Eilatimonas milleporae]RMB12290.1 FecR family protein [Eilatimonas milleporae]
MTRHSDINTALLDEAADWALRIEEDPALRVSEGFERWLHRSPDHIAAFTSVSGLWDDTAPHRIPRLNRWALALRVALEDHLPARAPRRPRAGGTAPAPSGLSTGRLSIPIPAIRAVALTACVVVCVAAALLLAGPGGVDRAGYGTAIGEIRQVALRDATVMHLDSATRVQTAFSDRARRVDLAGGRVFVDVTRMADRPFTVHVGDTGFTALGTAYSVHRDTARIRLEVYEGRVRIVRPGRDPVTITAGDGAHVARPNTDPDTNQNTDTGPNTDPNTHTATGLEIFALGGPAAPDGPAWTRNRAVFSATPLRDAVREINRYTTRKVIVADTALADHRISGVFTLTDTDAFIRTAALITGAAVRETDTAVHLSAAVAPPAGIRD